MDGGEEVAGGLVVACGDGSELLEPGELVLDQVARLEQLSVVISSGLAVVFGRDHRSLAGGDERIDHALLGIERFVGDQRVSLHGWQKLIGPNQIMGLAASQDELDRITERIDQGMDFGAQPSARAADCLVLASFFGAPALC